MGKVAAGSWLNEVQGRVGTGLVVKRYKDRTVVSSLPVIPPDKPTPLQQVNRGVFTEAVAYAKNVVRNPKTKAEWQERIGEGKSVYHAALKAYLAERKSGEERVSG